MQYTRGAAIRGGLLAVGFVAATAVLTGLVPTPMFDRYVPRSGTDVLFLSMTGLLLGAYTTQRCTRVDCAYSPSASLGGLGGFLAVSCPHCLPIVGASVSTSAIALYLVPVRPIVGVASVAVLAGVIVRRQRRLVTEGPATPDVELACPTCGAILRDGENDPDRAYVDGRMRLTLPCPNCADPLAVWLDVAAGDGLAVRKRVERGATAERAGDATPYTIAPTTEDGESWEAPD